MKPNFICWLGFCLTPLTFTSAGQIIHVDKNVAGGDGTGTDWPNAIRHFQDALAIVAEGDEIWLAAGVHYPDEGAGRSEDSRFESFQIPVGISVYGGFAGHEQSRSARPQDGNPTILSGDVTQNDDDPDGDQITANSDHIQSPNTRTVIDLNWLQGPNTGTTTIDRVTVTGGSDQGLAIGSSARSSSVAINACQFIGNTAAVSGENRMAATVAAMVVTDAAFTGCRHTAIALSFTPSIRLAGCRFSSNHSTREPGGAVHIERYTDIRLSDCEFLNNRSASRGGALHIWNPQHSRPFISISGCRFEGNVVQGGGRPGDGGGGAWIDGRPLDRCEITNCSFINNTSESGGGGLHLIYGGDYYFISDSLFQANVAAAGDGGGILIANNTRNHDIVIRNCRILANTARNGGGVALPNGNLLNCVVSGNLANDGGGIHATGLGLRTVNSTIAGNRADRDGGGIHANSVYALNSVIWANAASNNPPGGSPWNESLHGTSGQFESSIVQHSGGSSDWNGDHFGQDEGGNLDVDPGFTSTLDPQTAPSAAGDFRPTSTSPAIDSGAPTLLDSPRRWLFDIDGNWRHVGTVDRGAFEYQPTTIPDSDRDGLSDAFEMANTQPPSAVTLAPLADTDSDGIPAIAEFFFNRSDLVPDAGLALPRLGGSDIRRYFEFDEVQVNTTATALVSAELLESSDLKTWQSIGAAVFELTTSPDPADHLTLRFRVPAASDYGGGSRSFRFQLRPKTHSPEP